jgi:predicted S18 family serine protease
MNAVEIEQAISELAEQPFDPAEFPYAFLFAFGNEETTIKRLRDGASNKSDISGVLQTNNIHLATCAPGNVAVTLNALKSSPATLEEARALAKRAATFKLERGRLPSITSPDPWEKKMAEGVAYLVRMKQEAANG